MNPPTPPLDLNSLNAPDATALTPEEFDDIDAILDDLRTRYDETPQWEFCEGFMAALICCRRLIPLSEYFPVLLAIGEGEELDEGSFADAAQQEPGPGSGEAINTVQVFARHSVSNRSSTGSPS